MKSLISSKANKTHKLNLPLTAPDVPDASASPALARAIPYKE